MRLDLYLVNNKYFESRNKAKMEIENNNELINDKIINKASYDVLDTDKITILENTLKYVSRGGLKLEDAINSFNIDFNDKVILDIGASTGGFSDCALKFNAKLVYAVDVGSNQLHESLKNDKRVISLENTNILNLDLNILNPYPQILVMDVSFVSILYLIEGINKIIKDDTLFICLIKPQFEVGKMYLKNGVVKDKSLYIKIINNIKNELEKYNLGILKLKKSPILGGSGNKEFLCLIKRNVKSNINIIKVVEEC